MCCCPEPYAPCTQAERSAGCDAAFAQHILPLGPTPQRKLLRDALQRVRGSMRDSDPACVEFTAPAEPLSLCGAEEMPAVERSVGRADIFCEAVTWQWEQLGDGDPSEFAENGCGGFVPENKNVDGDARKSSTLAPGEAPAFAGSAGAGSDAATGSVLPAPRTLWGSKAQRETCPYWSQMGCLLDAFEKVCGTAEQMEQQAHPSLLDPYGGESLYMCCCPEPYAPCTQQERSAGCDAAFGQHLASLGPTPTRRLLRDALQRARGSMRDSDPACVEFTAPAEPLSLCGAEEMPAVERSVGRADIFCEAVTWQWEQLGDGDPSEFAENGCTGFVPENVAADGDARKGTHLAGGEAPTFAGVDLHDDLPGAQRHAVSSGDLMGDLAARASDVVASHPEGQPLLLHVGPEVPPGGDAVGVDTLLGTVVSALEGKGMWADTVTWFMSDRPPRVAGQRLSAPWEGGLRSGISFIHASELSAQGGTIDPRPVHVVDVAPTLLGLAGGAIGDADGVDIWPSLLQPGSPSPHAELLLELDTLGAPAHVRAATLGAAAGTVAAIRRGRWKLLSGFPGTGISAGVSLPPGVPDTTGGEAAGEAAFLAEPGRVAALGGGMPLASHGARLASEAVQTALESGRQTLLFDVEADPAETTDQSAAEPTIVAELQTALAAYGWPGKTAQSAPPSLEQLAQAAPRAQPGAPHDRPVFYSWRT